MNRPLLCAVAALALAGCSSMNPFAEKLPPPPCPATRILADAGDLTRFRDGPGRDIVDIAYSGRIVDIVGSCQHEIDKETKAGTLMMQLAPVVAAERGPADRDHVAQFAYFISVLDAKREPISKNVFTMRVGFEGNTTRTQATDDPVNIQVPLSAGQIGRNFEVIVGFQLTPEDLQYNRARGAALAR